MGILELPLLGIGLSMDAFAVSICKGLGVREIKPSICFAVGCGLEDFRR